MRTLTILAILLFLFTLQAPVATAQEYQVSPIRNYLTEYKDKHAIIRRTVDSRTDLNASQRQALYDSEIATLKERFRRSRTEEYEAKSFTLSASKSCTKKTSGGVKDCGKECVQSPDASILYTKPEWVRNEGDDKGTEVEESGACLRMTRAGKGRNAGTIHVTFRYRPEAIPGLVEKDLTDLFLLVIA